MADLPVVYWDSNVFLSYVNGIADRLPDIDALLELSGTEFQITTSALTIVEVAFGKVEQDGRALDPDVEQKIDRLWHSEPTIKVVEFYPLVAFDAKALIRHGLPHGWSLKPMDALHLATARRLAAREFHTYDAHLVRYAQQAGFPIGPPQAKKPTLPFPPHSETPRQAPGTPGAADR